MQKIISVFQRNYETDRLIRNEIVPGAEWVISGDGVATRKVDGACCMMQGGVLFKRYDAKRGKQPPQGFIPAQDPDPTTGHWPGWVVTTDAPEDRWFKAALINLGFTPPDGTYEAVGPHFQGNPEGMGHDTLIRHGCMELPDCPRDFEGIRDYLATRDIEGVVFWHPDGRMAKVKKKDYGMRRFPVYDPDNPAAGAVA